MDKKGVLVFIAILVVLFLSGCVTTMRGPTFNEGSSAQKVK